MEWKRQVVIPGALALILLAFALSACGCTQDASMDSGEGSHFASGFSDTTGLGPIPAPKPTIDDGPHMDPWTETWALSIMEDGEEIIRVLVRGCTPNDIEDHLAGILSEFELNNLCLFSQKGSDGDIFIRDFSRGSPSDFACVEDLCQLILSSTMTEFGDRIDPWFDETPHYRIEDLGVGFGTERDDLPPIYRL